MIELEGWGDIGEQKINEIGEDVIVRMGDVRVEIAMAMMCVFGRQSTP